MKKIVFYFLVLLAAVWFGVVMHNNPGYVLISNKDLSIETSLWFFIVFLVLLFLVFYIFLRFADGTSRTISFLRHWIKNRKTRRAHIQTVLGLYNVVEGDWKVAEKKLIRFAKNSDMPLINYLVGALVAHRQHEFKRRDNYLGLAQKVAHDRPLTVKLAEAILKIGNNKWSDALSVLEGLHKAYPRNTFVLELLQKVYLELENWSGLKKILPNLRKRHVLSIEESNSLEEKVYTELLLLGMQNDRVSDIWNNLPSYLRKSPALVAVYGGYLLDNDNSEDAEDLLKIVLRKNFDGRLLNLYASLNSQDPIKHLMRAEKWLKDESNNIDLLICLGKICRKQKLWGKARHYLEDSIKVQPTSTVYVELGQLMVEQNDPKGAVEFYEKAIKFINGE